MTAPRLRRDPRRRDRRRRRAHRVGRAERDLPRDARRARRSHVARRLGDAGARSTATRISSTPAIARTSSSARLHGATYAEIAQAGGGIPSTVRATRAASDDELVARAGRASRRSPAKASRRSRSSPATGSTRRTSAGSSRAARRSRRERRRRRAHDVARRPRAAAGIRGARRRLHRLVCREMIPAAARRGLADAVDAFCETIGFTPAQTRRVFAAARAHGLPVKLHADQLSDTGGAALAAEFGALSADHLEYTATRGVAAMAGPAPSPCCCPAPSICCARRGCRRSTRCARTACRWRSRPTAIPGTSPATSLLLMLNMACTLFRLTPEEALAGVTRNAARALGIGDRGRSAPGQRADLALWDIARRRSSPTGSAAIPAPASFAGARHRVGALNLRAIERGDSPLVIDVPHAGTHVPSGNAARSDARGACVPRHRLARFRRASRYRGTRGRPASGARRFRVAHASPACGTSMTSGASPRSIAQRFKVPSVR